MDLMRWLTLWWACTGELLVRLRFRIAIVAILGKGGPNAGAASLLRTIRLEP
jgi:hypothetical protein